jgi:uncharacterized damage-inducible protein DinB
MPEILADQYRRWFEYERDSHRKVIQSLVAVPPERRSSDTFRKSIELMAHVIAARWLWLFRLGAAASAPAELFPRNVALEDLASRFENMEKAWAAYLGPLSDADIARVFEYRSLEGEWYRNTVQDILAQLFGHSWYHRGQVAALVRALNCEPAVTDFLFWTREAIPAPGA